MFVTKPLFQELREKLISQINEIGKKEGKERDKKLKELLAKSFPVIKVKSLRPMVMCILSNTPQIDEKYLKVLVGGSKIKY
jgi:negative elongation factor B